MAAGLVPFAQGSDGGGSVRIPASVLRPVRDQAGPRPGQQRPDRAATSPAWPWNGPLARSVRDAAAMLDAMAVPMPGDPHWAPPLPAARPSSRTPAATRARCASAGTRPRSSTGAEVHPDCLAAYEAATEALTELGHEVEDIDAPFPPEAIGAFETVWGVSAASAPVDPAREGELLPLTRWLRARGAATSGAEFVGAMSQLQMLTRQWIAAHRRVRRGADARRWPARRVPVGWFGETGDPAEDFVRQKRFTPFTAIYNMTGQPAVNVPLHWTARTDLPIGVMLAGRPADEATLISLSAQLEDAVPWVDRHPPGW